MHHIIVKIRIKRRKTMELNYFMQKLFQMLNKSTSLNISAIETDDFFRDTLLVKLKDGNLYELKCRKIKKQQQYVAEEERSRCRKVINAFEELFQTEGSMMIDIGEYGFVKMGDYEYPYGFDDVRFYTDSKNMFVELWMDWLYIHLLRMTEGTPLGQLDYEDILQNLPKEKQEIVRRVSKIVYFS